MFFVNDLGGGEYEILDGDFLYLYPTLNEEKLIALTDEQYEIFLHNRNELTRFEKGDFVYQDVIVDNKKIKVEQQTQMWERIKQMRTDRCRGGCYVQSVDKWFHSDDASRQQYLFLRTLSEIPEKTMWKTMDNSFVEMTKELLEKLSLTLFTEEQANFAVAEQHRLMMLQAEKPLEYDFSKGWTKVFGE